MCRSIFSLTSTTERMNMIRFVCRVFSPVALLTMLFTGSALPVKAQLFSVISATTVDTSTNTITIAGSGFNTRIKPVVALGGKTLAVSSFSNTSVVASLGSITAPGTYLLTVTSGFDFAAADVHARRRGSAGTHRSTRASGRTGSERAERTKRASGAGRPSRSARRGRTCDPSHSVRTPSFTGGVAQGSGDSSSTDIADLTLPPGAYLLHAVVTANGKTDTLTCSIYDNGTVSAAALATGEVALTDATNLPILGTITVPSTVTTDTVRLFCRNRDGCGVGRDGHVRSHGRHCGFVPNVHEQHRGSTGRRP